MKEQKQTQLSAIEAKVVAFESTLTKDFFASVLVVSLFINLTVMTTWMALSIS